MVKDKTAMDMVRKAEDNAEEYREKLREADTMIDQLAHDHDRLYDLIVSVCARITSLKHWNNNPEGVLSEVEEMLGKVE